MGGIARVAATAIVLCVGFAPIRGHAAVILDSLLVRIYDNAGVLAVHRARAIKRAGEILARADLAVDWRDCPSGGVFARSECAARPGPGELVVRLVQSPKHDPNPRALGNALIDTTTGVGTLATVFAWHNRWVPICGT